MVLLCYCVWSCTELIGAAWRWRRDVIDDVVSRYGNMTRQQLQQAAEQLRYQVTMFIAVDWYYQSVCPKPRRGAALLHNVRRTLLTV